MRYLSLILSFILHIAVAVLLIQTIDMDSLDVQEFMELDLTEIEETAEIIQPFPVVPPKPESVPEPSPKPTPPEPATKAQPTPLPQDKTIVLDTPPPSPVPQSTIAAPPSTQPNVIPISPTKTPAPPLEEGIPMDTPDEATDGTPRNKIIISHGGMTAHRGHEARFGRSMMGDYYSYSSTEFSGQFTTRDNRTISIIDARNTKYGRFLIYDSKNKTLRRMKEFGKYVYTIGPSLNEDEPVVGTVTFLAKNDRIERFILITDDDRLAHFPRKVHVREDEVKFPTNQGIRDGYASLPPNGKNHQGVVLVHGNLCINPGLIMGFTRTLSAQGMASLSFMPRGCNGEDATPGSDEDLISDTRAALSHFGDVAQVDFRRIGLWGNGPGIPLAIKASKGGALSPPFMVFMLTDNTPPSDMPSKQTLATLDMPVLWLITGKDITKWQSFITTLEAIRDKDSKRFTIVVAPTKPSKDVLDATAEKSAWVESVTQDHARLAVSWINALDD